MLLREELFSFTGLGGSASRCRLRLFLPAKESGDDTYIAVLTDDQDAGGTNITNRRRSALRWTCVGVTISRRNAPCSIEHHDFRHRPGSQDDPGQEETFAQITFAVPETASGRFDYSQGQILGAPRWKSIDKQSVEILVGRTLAMTKPKPAGMKAPAPAHAATPAPTRPCPRQEAVRRGGIGPLSLD